MASFLQCSFILCLLFALLFASYAQQEKTTAILLPIRKNMTTLQYYTSFSMGADRVQVNAVIDLGGEFLWFKCGESYNSSSYRPILCGTNRCKVAKGTACSNNTCALSAYNPYKNSAALVRLGEDVIHDIYSTDGRMVRLEQNVLKFPFSCVDSLTLLNGLAIDTNGMIGFARNKIALPTQFSTAFNISNKFALCIPYTTQMMLGHIFIGGRPYYMDPYPKDLATLLTFTPLIINKVTPNEYFIGVTSIKIDGKLVPLNTSLLSIDEHGIGGTKISTVTPYSVLHTSIYKPIVEEFVKKATSRNIKRVASVAPFTTCFSSTTIGSTRTGPSVPTIDLVLHSESVVWRIQGVNSMVKVKENVMCLGFIDGGLNARISIVIGGHQLEENLVEFDLSSLKFGFSSSLLLKNTSCSQSRL